MDLLIALGIAALLCRAGSAFYATGLVRAKNSAATIIRSIADMCIAVLGFWAIGIAILVQSHNRWFWINSDYLFGPKSAQSVSTAPALFFYTIMILTATVTLSGAVAERCRLLAVCFGSLILAGFVLPATSQLAWAGWLKWHGFVDVAGGACLHVAAGVFALIACLLVGPRSGKFNRDGSSTVIPGHNLPMAAVGVLITLVGWAPYVGGASILRGVNPGTAGFVAAAGAMNVLLAACAAGVTSLMYSQLRYGKTDVLLALIGVLGGLVALCAPAATIPPWAAALTGAIAGIIVPLSVQLLDLRLRLDDPAGMIAIHLVGGAWGMLATGMFIPPMENLNRAQQIGIQAVGVVLIGAFAGVVALILFGTLKATIGLRAKEADEFDGLDLAEHDIGAYPDFQQNSIKSYHLRER